MFCSECGKEISNDCKFCPNCGYSLQKESITEKDNSVKEEFIIYEAKKHWITLVPSFICGFITYIMFPGFIDSVIKHENTLGSFSLLFILLAFTIHPILRFIFDKIEVTNKSFNITQGVIDIERISLPIDKINMFYVKQDLLGRILDYGSFIFESAASGGISTYTTIREPNKLVDIMNNIEDYI